MSITINPQRIPRDTLQSLVNGYIDQLYAEIDEAHATVARLSEENEGLKAQGEAEHIDVTSFGDGARVLIPGVKQPEEAE